MLAAQSQSALAGFLPYDKRYMVLKIINHTYLINYENRAKNENAVSSLCGIQVFDVTVTVLLHTR